MKCTKTGPELQPLFEGRWAVLVNGYVTYCGPEEECRKRLAILTRPDTRELQDQKLRRILS